MKPSRSPLSLSGSRKYFCLVTYPLFLILCLCYLDTQGCSTWAACQTKRQRYPTFLFFFNWKEFDPSASMFHCLLILTCWHVIQACQGTVFWLIMETSMYASALNFRCKHFGLSMFFLTWHQIFFIILKILLSCNLFLRFSHLKLTDSNKGQKTPK